MKDQIIFDTTDAGTIADSDKILSGLVSSSDGSTLITDTLDGGKQGLDVFVINSGLTTADAANKDEDTAHTTGDTGNFVLAVRNDTEGSLVDADGDYAPLQVDASGRLRVISDLDYDDPANHNEDDAHTSGDTGKYVLSVRQDTLATSTDADGDYQSFKTNSLGELYVKDTDATALLTTIDADTSSIAVDTAAISVNTAATVAALADLGKAEDDPHVSGDTGVMSLAVRNDAGTPLAADGDYIPLTTDATGSMYVNVTNDIDVNDAALANTALATAAAAVDTTAGGTNLVTELADRKYANIYNNGNRRIFIGVSGVTAASGFPLAPRSYLELRAGAAIDLHAIAAAGTQDVRILEMS